MQLTRNFDMTVMITCIIMTVSLIAVLLYCCYHASDDDNCYYYNYYD